MWFAKVQRVEPPQTHHMNTTDARKSWIIKTIGVLGLWFLFRIVTFLWSSSIRVWLFHTCHNLSACYISAWLCRFLLQIHPMMAFTQDLVKISTTASIRQQSNSFTTVPAAFSFLTNLQNSNVSASQGQQVDIAMCIYIHVGSGWICGCMKSRCQNIWK